MFWRVARCVSRSDQQFAEGEFIAIFHVLVPESVFRTAFAADVNLRRFESSTEFARSAYQVGVNVRFENMRNGKARFARHVDINVYIRSRIENRSDPFVIVTEQIRKFRDAFGLNGFENERHLDQLKRGWA